MTLTREYVQRWLNDSLKWNSLHDVGMVRELCRHWLAAEQYARDAAALARENAKLCTQRRWNFDKDSGGVRMCRGDHDKGCPCDYEYFVPLERAESAESANRDLQAEVDRLRDGLAGVAETFPSSAAMVRKLLAYTGTEPQEGT